MLEVDVMPAAAAPSVSWSARLAPYRKPDFLRSVWQLSSTLVLFVAGWSLMYASLRLPYWVTLLLAVPTGFMVIRLFIIQHDCGHGSFFKSARAADRRRAPARRADDDAVLLLEAHARDAPRHRRATWITAASGTSTP